MHSKRLQAFDFNRMQVLSDPYLLHSTDSSAMEGKLAKLWSHFLKQNESPDLTPPDFFLWGYIKQKIKERNPEDVPQLRTAITEIFRIITPEMCASACRNVNDRLLRCVANNGGCIP